MGLRGTKRKSFANTTPEARTVGMVYDRATALLTQIDARLEYETQPEMQAEWDLLKVLAKRLRAVLARIKRVLQDVDFSNEEQERGEEDGVDIVKLSVPARRAYREEHPGYFETLDKLMADAGEASLLMVRAEWLAMDLSGQIGTRYLKPKHDTDREREDRQPVLDGDGNPVRYMRKVVTSADVLAGVNRVLAERVRMANLEQVREVREELRADAELRGNNAEDFIDTDNDVEAQGHTGDGVSASTLYSV